MNLEEIQEYQGRDGSEVGDLKVAPQVVGGDPAVETQQEGEHDRGVDEQRVQCIQRNSSQPRSQASSSLTDRDRPGALSEDLRPGSYRELR